MFDEKDSSLIESHGLNAESVREQIALFKEGFPFLNIVAPATVGHGIERLDVYRAASLSELYDEGCHKRRIVKFVPASGAATRMFKDLFEFVSTGIPNKVSDKVIEQIKDFAFYSRLTEILVPQADDRTVIESIITSKGLGYGDKPKALLLFHNYRTDDVRTALEEHLAEGAQYAVCDGKVNIHFTVSPEHLEGFKSLMADVLPKYEARFGVHYNISYSVQKSSTDTIAVKEDNTPFRNLDGTLLFRPAGHGALLANLNEIDADIVFLKNIDNITTDSRRADTIIYKKALAGMLIEVQERIAGLLKRMDAAVNGEIIGEAEDFVRSSFNITLPSSYDSLETDARVVVLRRLLDRPVRVCGMVRNEGEPGGGPFFARNTDGIIGLQIAESSQIAPGQMKIISDSTHFNPVDIVCGIKDYKGQKFDLMRYVDPATGFISEKSKDGLKLKALELPGLWNGSMSDWNTIFVEVPTSTFSPVKVITDLLRPEHKN